MTIVAIAGDGATTLTLALAAAWRQQTERPLESGADRPIVGDVLVVDADISGGSIAGWLDTPTHPSLGTLAAAIDRGDPATETIRTMTHLTASGLRVVTAPVRRAAAVRAVAELPDRAIEALATTTDPVLVDLGASPVGHGPATFARNASAVVLTHRQRADSARAESVRLERLAESAEWLAPLGAPITLGVTGSAPFDPPEIARFVDDAIDGGVKATHELPEDELTAAVLSGRTGVSARRFARLPLMRSASELASTLRSQRAPVAERAGSGTGS